MLRCLFLDFNSYFASVEQQLRPELRGKPVAVVAVDVDTTSAIAASYEAKALGIVTGTFIRDAKRICPGLHVVQARPRLYVEFHQKLVEIIESCIHIDSILSIDEVVCGLFGSLRQRSNAEKLAMHIKQEIYQRAGEYISCSIGIAPNPFLAKVASDMQKPNGLVFLDDDDLPHKLYELSLTDFSGIGRQMLKRLNRCGIFTAKELCSASKEQLRLAWNGVNGERFYADLRGEIVALPPTQRSSVSHSHVLPPQMRNNHSAYAVIHRLIQKAAFRLRSYNLTAGELHIGVRYASSQKWRTAMRLSSTADTLELLDAFSRLWKRKPLSAKAPLKVGVVLSRLCKAETQMNLEFDSKRSLHMNLHKTVDALNKKLGSQAVYFAGAHIAKKSAPLRIAFQHIPDLNVELDG